ncbi:AAA family ATPase [Arthrobacter tecti]
MDEQMGIFLSNFKRLADLASEHTRLKTAGESLLDALSDYLGAPVQDLPAVSEEIPAHRFVDVDIAVDEISGRDPERRLIGVGGGQQRQHASFADLIQNSLMHFTVPVGQPDFVTIDTGPTTRRESLGFGIWLFSYEGVRLAALQRSANPQFGNNSSTVEVIGADRDAASAFLKEMRELLRDHSVIKGQVVSFTRTDYHPGAAGVTFHERPSVRPDEVVLTAGVLEQVAAHVLGIAEHRDAILSYGQHLKRGILLYGPPGTGKTHTVRHLLSESKGTTAILLSGGSLAFIAEAAKMARAMAPSLVVLEDVDLIAEDRSFGHGPQPLLFEVLDALDGLDSDVDVAFVLTTNRVDMLERALAQRPGRVDLAVEISLPERRSRTALLKLYSPKGRFSSAAIDEVAERTEGTTASFAKELTRRTVLRAATTGAELADEHLLAEVDLMMSEGEALTRSLLGSGPANEPEGLPGGHFPGNGGSAYGSSISFD